MAEKDAKTASANGEPIPVGKDVLEIAVNEAIRPLARHLVTSLPDAVLKDKAALWSMATPALAFAVARALPDKGVWKTIDTFQKEFFSEIGQALRDRAAGRIDGKEAEGPAIGKTTKAEATSFGLVFTTLGKTTEGLAVLQKIGTYGQNGTVLFAHFAGIPATQLEKQLEGFKPEAVDALMQVLAPKKEATVIADRDAVAEVRAARSMDRTQRSWGLAGMFFGLWPIEQTAAVPGDHLGTATAKARAFARGINQGSMMLYYTLLIVPLLTILVGNLLHSRVICVAGAIGSLFVSFTQFFASASPFWALALMVKPTRETAQMLLMKVVLGLIYFQSIVGIMVLALPVHTMPFGLLLIFLLAAVALAVGTPIRPGGAGFGFFIEAFYAVAELLFTGIIFYLVGSLFSISDGLLHGFIDQWLGLIGYFLRGFRDFPTGFDIRTLFGCTTVIGGLYYLVHRFRKEILRRIGKESSPTLASPAMSPAHNEHSGGSGRRFPLISLILLALTGTGVYLYDAPGATAMITSIPLLVILIVCAALFLLVRNMLVATVAFLIMSLVVFSNTRLYQEVRWGAQVKAVIVKTVATAEKGVNSVGNAVSGVFPDSVAAATLGVTSSPIEDTIDLDTAMKEQVFRGKTMAPFAELVPTRHEVSDGSKVTYLAGDDSLYVAKVIDFEGKPLILKGKYVTKGNAFVFEGTPGKLYLLGAGTVKIKIE